MLKQFLIALDQLINTLCGGWADETLSSRAWRENREFLRRLIDALFFWQPHHCRASYENELARSQLPPAMRGEANE